MARAKGGFEALTSCKDSADSVPDKSTFNYNRRKLQLHSSTRLTTSSKTKHTQRSPQLSSTLLNTIRSRRCQRTFRHATRGETTAVRLVATVDRQVATTITEAATTGATITTEAATWVIKTTATSLALLVATWVAAWDMVLKHPLTTSVPTLWEVA